MTVTLSTETGKIVAEKVNSGAYRSADEVVTSGVRLLDAREKKKRKHCAGKLCAGCMTFGTDDSRPFRPTKKYTLFPTTLSDKQNNAVTLQENSRRII